MAVWREQADQEALDPGCVVVVVVVVVVAV
jgi:hypothetical protein